MAAVTAGAGFAYAQGGDRLALDGYGGAGPTLVDVDFHVFVALGTDGGAVELVSARPVGAAGAVEADVQLVRIEGEDPVGTYRGRLRRDYVVVPLGGHVVDGPLGTTSHWLDVRVRPTETGVVRLASVAVTYRDGFLRERTAELGIPLCLVAMHLPLEYVDCPISGPA